MATIISNDTTKISRSGTDPTFQAGFNLYWTPLGARITSMRCRLLSWLASPPGVPLTGTVTAAIYESVFNGVLYVPTGSPLATGTVPQANVRTVSTAEEINDDPGDWHTFTFSSAIWMRVQKRYSIIFSVDQGTGHSMVTFSLSAPRAFENGLFSGVISKYDSGDWGGTSNWAFIMEVFGQLVNSLGWPYLPDTPDDRPDAYDPDDFWLPDYWEGGQHFPPQWGQPGDSKYFATGGGRWGQQLVAVGKDRVYYEELE